ncbi:hypothetical protein DIPPA_19363 [Diplonema papillatum]|nr:hypothetical protein DIPPA_19363 [Diplonema papillatum]
MNGTGEGSAARVRYVEEHGGRGLATARSCSAGDVLVEERPVVSCTVQKKGKRAVPACDHCQRAMVAFDGVELPTFLKDHRALWPYDPALSTQCTSCGAWYCSAACKEAALLRYHAAECPAWSVADDWMRGSTGLTTDGVDYSPSARLCCRMACADLQERDARAGSVSRTCGPPLKPTEGKATEHVSVPGVDSASAEQVGVSGVDSTSAEQVGVSGVDSTSAEQVGVSGVDSTSAEQVGVSGVDSTSAEQVGVSGVDSANAGHVGVHTNGVSGTSNTTGCTHVDPHAPFPAPPPAATTKAGDIDESDTRTSAGAPREPQRAGADHQPNGASASDAGASCFSAYKPAAPARLGARFEHYKHAIFAEFAARVNASRPGAAGIDPDGVAFRLLFEVALGNAMAFVVSPKHCFFAAVRGLADEAEFDPLTLLTSGEGNELEAAVHGLGLYPTLSRVNHSCAPSTVVNPVSTPDHSLSLVTPDDVPAGTPITLSYLALNRGNPDNPKSICTQRDCLFARRSRLQNHWNFTCACRLCADHQRAIDKATDWVLRNVLRTDQQDLPALDTQFTPELPTMQALDSAFDEAVESRGADVEQLLRFSRLNYQPADHMLGCLHYFGETAESRAPKREDVVDYAKALQHLGRASVENRGLTANSACTWATLAELLLEIVETDRAGDLFAAGPAAAAACDCATDGAVLLLRAAAQQGSPRGQCLFADLLSTDPRMAAEAWEWGQAAAEHGELAAVYLCAKWAQAGLGLPNGPNRVLAKSLFSKAKAAGYPVSDDDLSTL